MESFHGVMKRVLQSEDLLVGTGDEVVISSLSLTQTSIRSVISAISKKSLLPMVNVEVQNV